MSRSKRSLSLLIAALMVVSMFLTSCAGKSSKTSSSDGTAGTSSFTGKKVNLQWWLAGPPQQGTDRINAAVNQYLSKTLHKNYTVTLTLLGFGDYNTKATTALTTGQNVDIMFTAGWAANYLQYASGGYFTPLNSYIAKYPEVEKTLGATFLNASRIKDVNYALPTNKEKARESGWLLQKKYVDKYKIDLTKIKKTADLEPYFAEIKKNEAGVYPVWPYIGSPDYQWDSVLGCAGLGLEKGATKIVNTYTSDSYLNWDRMVNKWYKAGYINPDITSSTDLESELKTGKYFAISEQLKPGKDAEETASNGIQWVQVVTGGQPVISNNDTEGSMLAIPKTSKNKDEAFDFMSLLYSDSYLKNLYTWGQENTDYTKASDGRIELKKNASYAYGLGWTFGNQFLEYVTTDESADKWKQFEKFNASARPLDSLGFAPDATDLQTQLAALSSVQSKYGDLTSSNNIEKDISSMVKDYKSAGINDFLSALQKQYDAWRAQKKK